jgi:hypothetical protein
LILLSVGGLLGPQQSSRPAQSSSSLPPAREIIDQYIAAVGGREAIVGQRSRKATGRFEIVGQGLSGKLEMFTAAPDKALMRISVAGLGEIMTGFDGRVGWMMNPLTGPMILEGAELAQARDDADFYAVLHDEDHLVSMETVGIEEFDGKPCYRVRLVRKAGPEDFELFETSTGLLAGTIAKRDSPMGPVAATHIMRDYRQFGPLKVPTTIVQRMAGLGIEQVLTFDSIEADTVDPSVFELPPAIKALVK